MRITFVLLITPTISHYHGPSFYCMSELRRILVQAVKFLRRALIIVIPVQLGYMERIKSGKSHRQVMCSREAWDTSGLV